MTASDIMKDNGFHIVLLISWTAEKDGRCPLHAKDVTEVFQEEVECCGKKDIIFHPVHRNAFLEAIYPRTTTSYIRKCYEKVERGDEI